MEPVCCTRHRATWLAVVCLPYHGAACRDDLLTKCFLAHLACVRHHDLQIVVQGSRSHRSGSSEQESESQLTVPQHDVGQAWQNGCYTLN